MLFVGKFSAKCEYSFKQKRSRITNSCFLSPSLSHSFSPNHSIHHKANSPLSPSNTISTFVSVSFLFCLFHLNFLLLFMTYTTNQIKKIYTYVHIVNFSHLTKMKEKKIIDAKRVNFPFILLPLNIDLNVLKTQPKISYKFSIIHK